MQAPKQANPVQRFIQGVASLRPVASVFRHTFHHLDKALYRLLGQRTVSGILAGVPNIMLTTTGAKTGRLRTVPVIGVPVDGSVAVIGTRWGSETTPGWAYNLDHDPQAWIERDGTRTSVTARRVAEGTEYETILSDADRIYLGFPRYRGRITKRQVPVFVLEPQS
jgi:deazaflavin-dependent oxidoreductase (nitroreductase family)